jgi:hypothetical protein
MSETQDNRQSTSKFQVGEWVECIGDVLRGEYGSGWRKGLKFKITRISVFHGDDNVYWKGFGDGVFERALQRCNKPQIRAR